MDTEIRCIIRPAGWIGAYFGPYATIERAQAAVDRLIKFHNKKKGSPRFNRNELVIQELK